MISELVLGSRLHLASKLRTLPVVSAAFEGHEQQAVLIVDGQNRRAAASSALALRACDSAPAPGAN